MPKKMRKKKCEKNGIQSEGRSQRAKKKRKLTTEVPGGISQNCSTAGFKILNSPGQTCRKKNIYPQKKNHRGNRNRPIFSKQNYQVRNFELARQDPQKKPWILLKKRTQETETDLLFFPKKIAGSKF